MSKTVALFLSYLLHPAIVPVLGVSFLLLLSPYYVQENLFYLIIGYVFIGTYIFPMLMILLLKKLKVISSIHLPTASDRKYPFLTAILFYFMTAQSIRNFALPKNVSVFLFAGVALLFIFFILLRFIKASAHMAGMGSLIGLLIYISGFYKMNLLYLIMGLIVLAGLLGTARLTLKAHNPKEIYVGFMLGLCISTLFLFFI